MTGNELFGLYTECFPDYPVTRETFFDALKPESAHIIEQRQDGRAVGYAMVRDNSLSLLCVGAAYRRMGYGSTLLSRAESFIKHGGYDKIILGRGAQYLFQGAVQNVGFFEKRGYAASWTSVDMNLPLDGFDPNVPDIPPAPENVSFRFAHHGERDALRYAVGAVEAGWARFVDESSDAVFIAVRADNSHGHEEIAVSDGHIAGFAFLAPDGGRFLQHGRVCGSIGCVGVSESERNLGIGRQLVARGAAWLKEQGCVDVELGYTYLEAWYGRIGFKTVRRQWMGEKIL